MVSCVHGARSVSNMPCDKALFIFIKSLPASCTARVPQCTSMYASKSDFLETSLCFCCCRQLGKEESPNQTDCWPASTRHRSFLVYMPCDKALFIFIKSLPASCTARVPQCTSMYASKSDFLETSLLGQLIVNESIFYRIHTFMYTHYR